LSDKEVYPLDTSQDGGPPRNDWEYQQWSAKNDAEYSHYEASQANLTRFAFNTTTRSEYVKKRRRKKPLPAHPGKIIGGRPYYMAVMPAMYYPRDLSVFSDVIWRAQEILRKVTYAESMGLCNQFEWKYSTFEARRSGYRLPNLSEAFLIVDWSLRGKPMVRLRQKSKLTWEEYEAKIEEYKQEIEERKRWHKEHYGW